MRLWGISDGPRLHPLGRLYIPVSQPVCHFGSLWLFKNFVSSIFILVLAIRSLKLLRLVQRLLLSPLMYISIVKTWETRCG